MCVCRCFAYVFIWMYFACSLHLLLQQFCSYFDFCIYFACILHIVHVFCIYVYDVLYLFWMYFACTLHLLLHQICSYCASILHVSCTYFGGTFMYCACTLHAPCIYYMYVAFFFCMHLPCTLHVFFMDCACIFCV